MAAQSSILAWSKLSRKYLIIDGGQIFKCLKIFTQPSNSRASQVVLVIKNLPVDTGDVGDRHGFDPLVGKILWRRTQQPTPVFLPGESYGQRSLAGYSSWDHRVGHD